MKRLLILTSVLIVLSMILVGCGRDDALPQMPEAPLLFDDNGPGLIDDFDWGSLTAQEGLDLFTQGLDGVNNTTSELDLEGLPLETSDDDWVFETGETEFQVVEEDPDELELEGGMPLITTNPDALGTAVAFPVVTDTDVEEDDSEEEEIPLVEIVPIASLGEPEDLPKTNDIVSMAAVALLLTAVVVIFLVVARKKKAAQ